MSPEEAKEFEASLKSGNITKSRTHTANYKHLFYQKNADDFCRDQRTFRCGFTRAFADGQCKTQSRGLPSAAQAATLRSPNRRPKPGDKPNFWLR